MHNLDEMEQNFLFNGKEVLMFFWLLPYILILFKTENDVCILLILLQALVVTKSTMAKACN